MNKLKSYLGFAVKSNKLIYGIDNIELSKRKKYVILISVDASENLHKKAKSYAEKYSIPFIKLNETLEELIYKNNCKIIALLDKNMADAVINTFGR
ncbi:MAG: ribosomal L7Ae/L30e/S12e/Gadd45 family protein [Clostridia bacterium]|nr:ribosomal L7Ae/L30e/S12e/Gadd45 family protein [Clostridia bacterium]